MNDRFSGVRDLTFLENVKVYVGFDEDATAALREAHDIVAPHFAAIIDDFYDTIEAHPGARAAITGGATQIQRLKKSLLGWIDELFRGPHDEAYFEKRARIGRVHVQIDLPQMYMFVAMDRIRIRSVDVLRSTPALSAHDQRRMITALHRILDIELAIMLETYREDLLAKNRTAERLATIGQFAAGIGHELRNPLGVVESSAFLMRQRLEQLKIADPAISRHLEKITHEVHRSNRTITDLLELARSNPLQRRPVAVQAFIAEAIPAAGLPPSVQVTVDAPEGIFIDADADQLARVLTNLLINASQAMNGTGRITIQARRGEGETVLRVRDEGPGVPGELRHQIFEALFTTKAKGSGLGLALCRRIAAAHGGTVALEPSDHGAVFKVSIPDAAVKEAAGGPAAP
ncbi:MAG TPA: protoglobin domain-containing protein [Polyangia bacterium]|nr:protoglobin domain-containing protein [Polyangia bacterium]